MSPNLVQVGQSFRASSKAISEGLLCPMPPSMYIIAGRGRSMVIGLKKVGAALVARAASQMPHSLARIWAPEYVRNMVGRALASYAVCATTNVGHTPATVFGIAFIEQFSSPSFPLIMFLIAVSKML